MLDQVFVPEAVRALKLTRDYLVGFAGTAYKSNAELQGFLTKFFDENLNCEDLKNR